MKNKLIELKNKLISLKKTCIHEWDKPIKNNIKKEILEERIDSYGADVWFVKVPTGQYEETVYLSRKCQKCGKVINNPITRNTKVFIKKP